MTESIDGSAARFEIIKYSPEYERELMELIRREGDDWKVYWDEPNASRYRESFEASITYLALADGRVCGYSRSLKDALYIYVCDLLVDRAWRGHGLGERLMRCLSAEHPGLEVYVMSGSDGYYDKLGCKKEGSIYAFR